jgi:membrane protease YdiL (CAAX protease family)
VETQVQAAHPYNLLLYFVGAYAITWLCWGLVALAARQLITLPIPQEMLMLIGGLGPLLMAITLSAQEGGGAGVRGLLAQLLRWRIHPIWYVVALLFPLVAVLITTELSILAGAPRPPFPPLAQWMMIPIKFVFVVLLGGGLWEEFGWRGYALPRLQSRYGALGASLILGLIWAGWHIPQWFIPGEVSGSFLSFVVGVITFSVLLAWLYNNSGGSLLIVVLAHTMNNVFYNLFAATMQSLAQSAPLASILIGDVLLPVIVVLLIALLTNQQTLMRTKRVV